MHNTAVLDNQGRLTGFKAKKKLGPGDVEVPANCDLPTDGTYRWTGTEFMPLGRGYGQVRERPPVSEARVLYMLVRAGANLPAECGLWADWYEAHMLRRERERDERNAIVKGRMRDEPA